MVNGKIEHLEDLAFSLWDCDLIEIEVALLMWLAGIDTGQMSVKLDGSPAVVFGKMDGKCFLSTKSYFNKTPIKWHSKEEIEASGRDPKLIEKLLFYWDCLGLNDLPFNPDDDRAYYNGEIYMGDIMADFTCKTEHGYRPNIIEYRGLDPHYGFFTPGFCINVHTELGTQSKTGHYFNTVGGKLYPKERITEVGDRIKLFMPKDDIHGPCTTKEHLDACKKAINSILREEDCPQGWFYLVPGYVETKSTANWRRLHDLKMYILDILNKEKHYRKMEPYINGEPCNHEGYVFTYKGRQIKLVDRWEFSRRNFSMTQDRGWVKHK